MQFSGIVECLYYGIICIIPNGLIDEMHEVVSIANQHSI